MVKFGKFIKGFLISLFILFLYQISFEYLKEIGFFEVIYALNILTVSILLYFVYINWKKEKIIVTGIVLGFIVSILLISTIEQYQTEKYNNETDKIQEKMLKEIEKVRQDINKENNTKIN